MPSSVYVPSRVGEGYFTDFVAPAGGATDTGKAWLWNSATGKFEPTALTVYEAAGAVAAHVAAADPHTQYALLAGRSGGQIYVGGTGTTDDLTLQTTSGVGVAGADMHFLVGSNGATEALTILNNGRVGIGITAPGAGLEVVASTATLITRTIASGAPAPDSAIQIGLGGAYTAVVGGGPSFLFFGNNTTPAKAFIGRMSAVWENGTTGSEAGALVFNVRANTADTTASTERMRITAGGNVSIGIGASPTALLHLVAGTTARAQIRFAVGVAPTTPNDGDSWHDGALTFFAESAATNVVVDTLRIRRSSSGTPAVGYGVGFSARLKSATVANQDAGRLTWEWDVATDASRASRGKLTAFYTTTERVCIDWKANSTVPLLGFLGATPAAQQTGGVATAGATWTATEQAMLQAAYNCLRTFGLLS